MPTATATLIDTGKVSTRRNLRFNTPAEMDAEVARLIDAQRASRLTCLGNWTLGQILNHLGVWASFAFEEHPLRPPFFVRWIVGLRKNKYLNQGLPAGVSFPRVVGGTIAC